MKIMQRLSMVFNLLNSILCRCVYIGLLFFATFTDAQQLTLVSSEGPPHTINDEVHSGIDLDVTKAILKRLGFEVKLMFVPLGRAEVLVKTAEADLMAPIFHTQDSKNFFISEPIVTYKPMVFSLKSAKLSPANIMELSNYAVITFQGAPGYFGEEFKAMAAKADYVESPRMSVIPNLLHKDRFDFAVLDKYIFYYFYRQNNKARSIAHFQEHPLIPPVKASVAFKDAQLRDAFNHELNLFKQEDSYQQIVNHYLGNIPF